MSKRKTTQEDVKESSIPIVLQRVFIALLLIGILFNCLKLTKILPRISKIEEISSIMYEGIKFTGMDQFLKKVDYVGYFTDKNLDNNDHARQFTLAQYALAPKVLDLNNTDHKFVIFDCSTPQKALEKINDLGLSPYKKNPFGIYLAINPKVKYSQ